MAKKTTIAPFSAAHTYIAYIRGELQVMSLAAYASDTDITAYASETDKRAIYIFLKRLRALSNLISDLSPSIRLFLQRS